MSNSIRSVTIRREMDTIQTDKAAVESERDVAARDRFIHERASAVLTAESAAILDARSRLGDSFTAAVRTILECRGRVCVTGVGKAGLIGAKIQATLASTGTLAYGLHPVEALHGDLGMIHGDDVVIALSKSGSSELVELLPRLKDLGCTVILLTSNPDSAAAKHADHILHLGTVEEACPLQLAPSSSTASMLALGDALALTVMELKNVDREQYASYHPGGALGRYLMTARELMRTGADCPKVHVTERLEACHAAILAAPCRAGAAVIVDDTDRLVGFVTHGDFFRLLYRKDWSGDADIADIMTRSPKFVRADDRANEAMVTMKRYAIDELPVLDEHDRVVGMIDIQDLINRGF